MIHPNSYIGHHLAGLDPGDIDDWVDRWHSEETEMDLHDHLGMTREEYGNWALAPDSLEHIIAIRRMVEAARLEITHAIAKSGGEMH